MEKFLSRINAPAYALLRIVSGLMFMCHGLQKIFGFWGGKIPATWSQIWFGGLIELIAGLLIAVGRYTWCAAFVASGTMAVAYVQFHWKVQWGENFFPVNNKGELALLYAFVFLFIATQGPGIWSLGSRKR